MKQRWTVLLSVSVAVVTAFAIWAVSLVIQVNELRHEVELRVGWLSGLQRAQVALDGEPQAVDDGLGELRSLLSEICSARPESREVVAACERTNEGLGAFEDDRRKQVRASIDALVRAIRAETGALSSELGQRWNALYGLVAASLLFAFSALAMVFYLHRVQLAHAEKAREAAEAKLRHADRLSAIGTLAAAVAHEVNTPLATVLLTLRLMEDQLEVATGGDGTPAERARASREIKELLSDTHQEVQKVAAIVRDLLGFAQADEGKLELVQVTEPLEAALGLIAPTLLKGGRIERAYTSAPPVRAVPRRLEQVFLNLLLNAAQAMDDNPPARAVLRLVVEPTPDGEIRIEIADSGAGVSDDVISRGFEPFVTTKPPGRGTGLGLFVCAGILKALGGSLSLSRRPEGGTSAVVVLPTAVGHAKEAQEVPKARSSVTTQSISPP